MKKKDWQEFFDFIGALPKPPVRKKPTPPTWRNGKDGARALGVRVDQLRGE